MNGDDDNPRPDLFNDRRSEGRRTTPSYATPGAAAAASYLKHGVNQDSLMRRSATLAAASKARVKARRAGNA
jgi:hypothetical protein